MREMELWRDKIQLRIRDRIQKSASIHLVFFRFLIEFCTQMEQFSRECIEIDVENETPRDQNSFSRPASPAVAPLSSLSAPASSSSTPKTTIPPYFRVSQQNTPPSSSARLSSCRYPTYYQPTLFAFLPKLTVASSFSFGIHTEHQAILNRSLLPGLPSVHVIPVINTDLFYIPAPWIRSILALHA